MPRENKKSCLTCSQRPPSHTLYGWFEDLMCVSVTGEVENQLSFEDIFEKLYFT